MLVFYYVTMGDRGGGGGLEGDSKVELRDGELAVVDREVFV